MTDNREQVRRCAKAAYEAARFFHCNKTEFDDLPSVAVGYWMILAQAVLDALKKGQQCKWPD